MMKRGKRDHRPLLMQDAPMLSDELPPGSTVPPPKKKSWRKRLFGKTKPTKGHDDEETPQYEGPSGVLLSSSSSNSEVMTPSTEKQREDDVTESTTNTNNRSEGSQPQSPATLTPRESSLTPVREASPASRRSRVSMSSPPYFSSRNPREMGPVEAVLSRPFGRENLLVKDHTWIVQVAHAEWEPEESVWKYRVGIQKRVDDGSLQDYTNGLTFRSLSDFYWLEKALTLEYHGGLLLPSLSIALGIPEMCDHEVDSKLLVNWLSDILNGIRGQGELILNLNKVDLMSSESMEAFLYRTDLSAPMELPKTPAAVAEPEEEKQENMWKWMYPELCSGGGCDADDPLTERIKSPVKGQKIRKVLNQVNCSSQALGGAQSFNVQQDSFVEAATFDTTHAPLAIHSDLLHAEKDLVWSWRTRSLKAMEKLRVLQEQEKHIGAAWKRFAISVSNLFAYEKDVESARLGHSKSRRDLQMPYRKLQKSAVDDCLRIMARKKIDRATPGLERLGVMLSAYVADLSAVQPAVQAYLESLQNLSEQNEKCDILKAQRPKKKKQPASLADQIQASIIQVKKQLVEGADAEDAVQDGGKYQQEQQRLQTMENRVLVNEALLKDFLTILCKTAPVRTSRMFYSYLTTEASQCEQMHSAAMNTKTKINVASKDSLSKMINRHQVEAKEDRTTELQLVQRIVNIGNAKKFLKDDGSLTEEIEKGVEINKDVENEAAKLRDNALNLCRGRLGRWDAKVAMGIMEAVGVTDANVRVEETTRDLRMVRKYAIGLRENLQRCVEALEILKMSILQGNYGDIRDLRQDFMLEIQSLCSTTYLEIENEPMKPLKRAALHNAGIRLNDPSGWLRPEGCGGLVKSYMEARESGTEWLLGSLGELLKEYSHRVECVESFVYMECVGIQLEKHFSQNRATALATFEKRTDITSAINIATRKRMPVLVKELQAKLDAVGSEVTHTTVKEAKEAHLESKTLKQELHDLAMRQLTRSRETSTERAIALMTVWSKEEDTAAIAELQILNDFVASFESSIERHELDLYREASPPSR